VTYLKTKECEGKAIVLKNIMINNELIPLTKKKF
jgi:hypothetical protein